MVQPSGLQHRLAGVVLAFALTFGAATGRSESVRFVSQLGGANFAVYADGALVYIGMGPHLQVWDVAAPASPVVVGSVFLQGVVEDVVVSQGWAYIAAGTGGFQIVDVGNPAQPVLVSSWSGSGDVASEGVFVVGNRAYVADETSGLLIFNVSNPSSPTLLGSIETPGDAGDVFVVDTLAYVADGLRWDGVEWVGNFQIVDVTDPSSPALSGSYTVPDWAEGVYVDAGLAYVASGWSGLQILDVSDPSSPTLAGVFPGVADAAQDVVVVGTLAYIADAGWGLKIVDVTDPASPLLLGEFNTPVGAEAVFVAGTTAYVADTASGLHIVDVAVPSNPTLRGVAGTVLGDASSVHVSGGRAFATAGNSLQIVDVSNPLSPVFRGQFKMQEEARDVHVVGDLAYVAAGAEGLQIVDVSNPSVPSLRGTYPMAAAGVFVDGPLAYIANETGLLLILDVSDPSSPVSVGFSETAGMPVDVFVANGRAYVADSAGGLQILDVVDPSAPVFLGAYDTPGYAQDVHVVGDLAFVADYEWWSESDWTAQILILDVSDPTRPALRGAYDTAGLTDGVHVVGNRAYVAAEDGLLVLDVSDPARPMLRGTFDTGGVGADVFVAGGLAYVADEDSGLWLLQFFGDAPRIRAATVADANGNGAIEPGDQLVLTLDRSVIVTPGVVQANHFFLAVEGDSLGGAGFAIDVNPLNSRQIVLTLGSGVTLTAAGDFSLGTLAPNSPSGIDFAASLPFGAITSLEGISVTDGGVPGFDDSGIDVELTLVQGSRVLSTAGGNVSVTPSPDAAYTEHELRVPPGALATTTTFTLRQPPGNVGVTNAFQVQSSDPAVTFTLPATISVEYREGDIDWERGQIESEMRVHQWVENPPGTFQFVPVPGRQTLTRASRPLVRGSVRTQDAGGPQVSVEVSNLNPAGSVGTVGVFAGIPVDTVDERSIYIKPEGAPGIDKAQLAGPVLKPGPKGAYTLHQLEFPGYVETTSADPARLLVTMRTAMLAERLASPGGQSFPTYSGAVFCVEVENASGTPVAFADPVNVTVQFQQREPLYMSDVVRFGGRPTLALNMFLVCDCESGDAVNFVFANVSPQQLNPVQGTVTGENLVGLTGADGKGVFGVVAADFFTPASYWSLYR